jgi:hypothetical protein
MKNYISLATLVLCMSLLTGYQFMSAQWSDAPGTPPANNTPAPINVSGTTQAKSGNLAANIFAATTEMRSDRYCDALGGNCFDPNDVTTNSTSTTSVCTLESRTQSACVYSSGSVPACPTGYTQVGQVERQNSCSTNNYTFTRQCLRVTC